MCPAKGMWGPRKRIRSLAHGARLSPLSAEDTEGAVFNSQLDRRRAAGANVSSSHVAVSLFAAPFVCRSQLTATPGPPVLERAGDVGGREVQVHVQHQVSAGVFRCEQV